MARTNPGLQAGTLMAVKAYATKENDMRELNEVEMTEAAGGWPIIIETVIDNDGGSDSGYHNP